MLRKKKLEIGVPGGLALGLLICIAATLMGAAIIAWLVINGTIGEGSAEIGVWATQLLSAIFGTVVSTHCIKKMRLQISILSGVIYYLFLTGMHALLFDGEYVNLGITALIILIGCCVVAFLPSGNNRARKSRSRKYR